MRHGSATIGIVWSMVKPQQRDNKQQAKTNESTAVLDQALHRLGHWFGVDNGGRVPVVQTGYIGVSGEKPHGTPIFFPTHQRDVQPQ